MRMYDIIMKKRNGGELSKEEIRFFIEGYTKGEIPDYQVSALMMAIYFQKMTERETYELPWPWLIAVKCWICHPSMAAR